MIKPQSERLAKRQLCRRSFAPRALVRGTKRHLRPPSRRQGACNREPCPSRGKLCAYHSARKTPREVIRKENNGCPPTISVQSASAISFPFQTALTMAAPRYFHRFTVSWSPQILTDAIQVTESRPSWETPGGLFCNKFCPHGPFEYWPIKSLVIFEWSCPENDCPRDVRHAGYQSSRSEGLRYRA